MVRSRVVCLAVITVVSLPAGVAAQEGPAGGLAAAIVEGAVGIFQKPVRPVVTTVAPGGGIGAGMRYATSELWDARGFASLEAVVTIRGYWSAQANLGLGGERYRVETYALARDMKRLDLYGLGNHTRRTNRTTFRLRSREVGGLGKVRFGSVELGGRVESLWPVLEPGESPDYPSFEERFTEATLPGMVASAQSAHYETFVHVTQSNGRSVRRLTRGEYRLAYGYFADTRGGKYSFQRVTGEIQQRLPALHSGQRLTVHLLVSTTRTGSGHAVPFYFQDTLGGTGAVRMFDDGIIGTDGSTATLRGFDDLRFRGPHLFLLQAEYRWPVWGPIDVTAFVDAGKVTMRRDDLILRGLQHDFGVSVSIMTGKAAAFRVDTGFGGGEGAHVFVSFSTGALFPQ